MTEETKGTTACLGKVGPLPIGWWTSGALTYEHEGVRYFPEDDGFPEKVILIGEMTSPEIFGVIGKIAGIATEQGGITCHAAIVAREMKLPTIVGCGSNSLFGKWGAKGEVSIEALLEGGTLTWHGIGSP